MKVNTDIFFGMNTEIKQYLKITQNVLNASKLTCSKVIIEIQTNLYITGKIITDFEQLDDYGVSFFELSKPLDCLSHSIFHQDIVRLILFYLSNHAQRMAIDESIVS